MLDCDCVCVRMPVTVVFGVCFCCDCLCVRVIILPCVSLCASAWLVICLFGWLVGWLVVCGEFEEVLPCLLDCLGVLQVCVFVCLCVRL